MKPRHVTSVFATSFLFLTLCSMGRFSVAQSNEDAQILSFPEKFSSYTVGAGGRYMVFHFKESKKLKIVDTAKFEPIHEIPNVPDDVRIAAGSEKLMLVMPGQRMMQRWSLTTFKREKIEPLPGKGNLHTVLMGPISGGPLFLGGKDDAVLVDVDTMKQIAVGEKVIGASGRYGYKISVSADGKTFAGIVAGLGPVSYNLMRLLGNKTFTKNFDSTSNAIRESKPSADGSLIFISGKIYDANLNRISAEWFRGDRLFPTVDPRFFIAVRFKNDKEKGDYTTLKICTTADRKILRTVNGLKEMAPTGRTNQRNGISRRLHEGDRECDQRFFYFPVTHSLVTLHYDNQRVFFRKFDLLKELGKSGEGFLFVESNPPPEALRGRPLKYQIKVQSKAGKVKYNLENGPKGMKLSKTGLMTWIVPREFQGKSVDMIVSITDGSGKEMFHSWKTVLLGEAARAAQGWKLVWSDEFNYEGLPDKKKWDYEEGFVRNNEMQYYTRARKENARVEKGMLVIEGRKEKFKNPTYKPDSKIWKEHREFASYTAASLITRNKASWKYGRIEVRAKLPQGKGIWPAIWTLGTNITEFGWPRCGEIDIMEFVGKDPNRVHANAHYAVGGKHRSNGGKLKTDKPYKDFHVYAIEWREDRMDFFFDKTKYHTFIIDQAGKGKDNPFRKPHYLLMNLALGGSWGGPIDDAVLPQKYLIDYVRVYKSDKGQQKNLTQKR